MALGKVDLGKQIVILQNVSISTSNIFNSVISFLTERHKRQREIILKCWLLIQIKGEIQKKKNKNLQDTGLDLEEVTHDITIS